MSRTTKMVAAILIGGLCSGVLGGLTLATPAFLDTSSTPGFMGSSRDWVPVLFVFGAFFGVLHGVLTGSVIGAVNAHKGSASLIGAAVALPVAAYLFLNTTYRDKEVRLIATLCPFVGALTGLLVSIFLSLISRKSGEPPS